MDKEPDFDNHLMDRSFIDADIAELVDKLTQEEKRILLAADGWWHTAPIPRLNIPSIKVTDGPSGARGGNAYKMTPATSFANATCLGATFDTDLATEMGKVLAADTKARGALCLLGPTINIQRSPLGGRAFESFSEDPTLSGRISAAYTKSLQENGVSATPKHYLCNDQEHDRVGQDAIVQPRALREIYLRPFQITQALANPWAVMSSYNKVNGTHVAESKDLLEGVLRKEWGHEGIVISDWYGTYSSGEALNAGLDIEFPGPTRWRQKVHFDYLLQVHKVDPRQIDILVTRVLQWIQKMVKGSPELTYAKDKLEKTRWDDKESDAKLVRKIVTSGITLLKNEGEILPVRKGKVAVIGPNAKAKVFTGGGSARLQPAWSSTPWEGMVSEKPDDIDLEYSVGTLTAKYYPLLDENFTCSDGSVGFDGWHYAVTDEGEQAAEPVGHDQLYRSELRFNNFARKGLGEHWYTELKTTFTSPITGVYEFECTATGKYRFWIDGKLEIEEVDYEEKGTAFYGNGTKEKIVKLNVEKGKKYELRFLHDTRRPENVRYLVSSGLRYDGIRIGAQPAYDADQAILDAVKLAKEVDTVVLSVGLNQDWESEGDDRPTLHLPMRTDELVFKVAEANPNTVVVIQGGSAVAMPWLDQVKGVVQAWYGGGEAGTGIADIVYGHINPSGRLPLTFPKRNLDNPAALSFKSFNGKTYYEEGIWVGYRHYNAREIQPLFPFGFGLSYTTFDYENLQITSVSPKGTKASDWKLKATVTVKNTGSVAGSHSVHFYLSPPPETATGLKHPEYTLQAFTKVYDLGAGQSKTIDVEMDKYAISHWDELWNVWRAEPGTWTVKVGRDAQTFYGAETFEIGKDISWTGL